MGNIEAKRGVDIPESFRGPRAASSPFTINTQNRGSGLVCFSTYKTHAPHMS